ncbi:NACHT domain-containing protein [Actinoallomurus sp. NPDC052274]|uniref:NACHT domain-containing protein n=1 Tax=Actinoallomurus sp. NPDC052274 TaxID=3155420 RepID=UPI0034219A7B
MNNYVVEGPVMIHGAEVDLVATPLADPFGSKIYIEATIEYVDNEKYRKDVGKLAMLGELERDAKKLIVSSRGFSLPVKERASKTRIETLTFDDLFARFERFDPYINSVLNEGALAKELESLNSIYEEPNFEDSLGVHQATDWLSRWRTSATEDSRWLIIAGEYGTGKSALTKVLQRRWTEDYRADAKLALPFRIELRDFTRQFDARGLLHHFLDNSGLGHIPIEFVFKLIRSGRVLLLLDGYDEMAQYLSARERRVCLEALAQLSSDGAQGILTSRPNYFSEVEEFHVFDILYASLERGRMTLTHESQSLVNKERELDSFIESHFLHRHERNLQDLTPRQTEELVRRVLAHDSEGQAAVLSVLRRVFRTTDEGASLSLSGKPVIIAYLLDVVEQLKENPRLEQTPLTEWEVYKLVVDELMIRDFRQAGHVLPDRRRSFLRMLSEWLSRKESLVIGEAEFRELIKKDFANDLRYRNAEDKNRQVEEYFEDLRRSGTLTRSSDASKPGWRFSHNSLREFLLCEHLLSRLERRRFPEERVPITDAMRLFVRSRDRADLKKLFSDFMQVWGTRAGNMGAGRILTLLWDGLLELYSGDDDPVRQVLVRLGDGSIALNDCSLERISLNVRGRPSDLSKANCRGAEWQGIDAGNTKFEGANFRESILESVSFEDADLADSDFRDSLIVDLNIVGANIAGADFRGIAEDSSFLVEGSDGRSRRIDGLEALGFLSYRGAETDAVSPFLVFQYHPKFAIVEKICTKLSEQNLRQRLGVVQKGSARQDVDFAKSFLSYLEKNKLVRSPGGRSDLVAATPEGRRVFTALIEHKQLEPVLTRFLSEV